MNSFLTFVASALALASAAMGQKNIIAPNEVVQFALTADQSLCVGVASGTAGSQIVGTPCTDAANTAFNVTRGSDTISQLVFSGTTLCITGRGASASAPMTLDFCEDDNLERWIYATASSELTRTSAPDAGDCITLATAGVGEPVTVQPCASSASAGQQFTPVPV